MYAEQLCMTVLPHVHAHAVLAYPITRPLVNLQACTLPRISDHSDSIKGRLLLQARQVVALAAEVKEQQGAPAATQAGADEYYEASAADCWGLPLLQAVL